MPKKLQVGLWLALILLALAVPVGVLAKTTAQASGNAFVMVGNFSPNSSPVNIYINGALLGRNLSFSQATMPVAVKAGEVYIEVRNAATGAQLVTPGYKTLNANDYYMVPFMNTVDRSQFGAYRIPVYETLGTSETRVQFFHAIPRGPRLDVNSVTGTGNTTLTQIVDAMGYVEDPRIVDRIPAGNYRYQVWTDYRTLFPGAIFDPNPQADRLVMDLGNLALRARVIYSFFIIGSNSGSSTGNLALVLAMPYGGGAPVAPPGAPGTGPVVAQRSVTPGPSPTPTRTPTATPTSTPTPTPTPVPPRVSFTTNVFGVLEGNIAGINVQMDRTWPSAIAVTYSFVTGGTASSGDLSSPTSGTLTFNPGETQKLISIGTQQDNIDEAFQESAFIQLTSLSSPALFGSPSTAVLLIEDDDPTPVMSLSASAIQVVGGNSITLTVSISSPSSTTITATLDQFVTGTTAQEQEWALSTNSIILQPGTTSQTVTLQTTSVPSSRLLRLVLSNPSSNVTLNTTTPLNITITPPPSPTPPPPPTAAPSLTPVPNFPDVSLTAPVTGDTVTEGTTFQITLTISAAPTTTGSVVVSFGTVSGATTADFTIPSSPGQSINCGAASCTVPFAPGDPLSKTVFITVKDDGNGPANDGISPECDEQFSLSLGGATNLDLGAPTSAVVTIADDASCP